MARSTTRVQGRTLTREECGEAGILARLATEDWTAMTAAALASPNHMAALDRWIAKAREQNPRLNDEQAERLAILQRREHFRRLGRLSAQARKLAREAQDEFDRAPADEPAA